MEAARPSAVQRDYKDFHVERLRFKLQLLSIAILNIGAFQWHTICFPVLNCHSCPVSVFACPLGIIGQFAGVGLVPLSVVGGIAVVGLVAGRILCGWVCPFGFLQDLLYKVPFVRFAIPAWTRFIKYGVFAVLVVGVPVFLSTSFPLSFLSTLSGGNYQVHDPLGHGGDRQSRLSSGSALHSVCHCCRCNGASSYILQGAVPVGRVFVSI